MNKKFTALCLMMAMGGASFAQSNALVPQTLTVTVANNSLVDKHDAPVAVDLSGSKKIKGEVVNAFVEGKDGTIVPSQLDDMKGDDFKYDELFFVTDIKAHETKTFTVHINDNTPASEEAAKALSANPRVYTALQLRDKAGKYPDVLKVEAAGSSFIFNDIYMHGMTVESELVGYRIYFDHRQNVDLYGKKYRRIELPVTQFYTSEQQLADGWGVDVLWAGQAIGCGSFKDYDASTELPKNWEDVKVRGQRVVTSGPLRTVVELCDLGTAAGDGTIYDMCQRYTLVAGHRDVKVDISFNKKLTKSFCTGVQKVGVTATDSVRMGHTPAGMIREDGIAASWGCDYPDMGKKDKWGPQPIGMAVYVPKEYIRSSREDDLNYTYQLGGAGITSMHYWLTFCAAMEDEGSHNAQEWFSSLDDWKESITHPVKVMVK